MKFNFDLSYNYYPTAFDTARPRDLDLPTEQLQAGIRAGAEGHGDADDRERDRGASLRRRPRWLRMPGGAALGWILLGALVLRVWSLKHGLPYVYNTDEEQHFVPKAVQMIGGTLDPNYFENPPALTYLFFAVFKMRFHAGFPFGSHGFLHAFRHDPTAVFTTARFVVALLGTLSVGLVYWVGARFYERRVGLVAAVLMACAFLPVFYAKQALNDAVTLVPIAVALAACLFIYEDGRLRHWILAGAAVGVATDVKYTAAAMAAVVGLAGLLRVIEKRDTLQAVREGRRGLGGGVRRAVRAARPVHARAPLAVQAPGGGRGRHRRRLGQARPEQRAGLGLLHLDAQLGVRLAAHAGRRRGRGARAALEPRARPAARRCSRCSCSCSSAARRATSAAGSCPPTRRWPCWPPTPRCGRWTRCRRPGRAARACWWAWRPALLAMQGLWSSVRVNSVLAKTDTRTLARQWIERSVPAGSGLVVEPAVFPKDFLTVGKPVKPYRLFPIKPPFQGYEKNLTPR